MRSGDQALARSIVSATPGGEQVDGSQALHERNGFLRQRGGGAPCAAGSQLADRVG
jgi:hypothetical protein